MKYLIGPYTSVIVPFALYGTFWGEYAYKGFAYNLGRSVLWPTIVFPVLGQILGAIVLVGVLIFILSRRG